MNTLLLGACLLVCLSLSYAQRTEPEHRITCAQLDGVTVLPGDKDIIQLSNSTDPCLPADEIGIELSFDVRVSRWKAVRVHRFDNTGEVFPLVELNCRGCTHMVRLKWSLVQDYGLMTLWKDELVEVGERAHFGINDTFDCFRPGYKYTFNWLEDGSPVQYVL